MALPESHEAPQSPAGPVAVFQADQWELRTILLALQDVLNGYEHDAWEDGRAQQLLDLICRVGEKWVGLADQDRRRRADSSYLKYLERRRVPDGNG